MRPWVCGACLIAVLSVGTVASQTLEADGRLASLPTPSAISPQAAMQKSGPRAPKGSVSPSTVLTAFKDRVYEAKGKVNRLKSIEKLRTSITPLKSSSFIIQAANSATVSAIVKEIDHYNTKRNLTSAKPPKTWNPKRDAQKTAELGTAASDASQSHPNQARHLLNPNSVPGLIGHFTQEFIDQLKANFTDIKVEPDHRITAAVSSESNAPWNLQRISEISPNYASTRPYYFDSKAGSGISVYIIDSGIYTAHTEFSGRAQSLVNYVSYEGSSDLNGHGTNVASVIGKSLYITGLDQHKLGGTTYGVAKHVQLYSLKILDRNLSGYFSNLILAIQYVQSVATPGSSVINISASGPISSSVNAAIQAANNAGIAVVVAAGECCFRCIH